jgi:hypothetical protein
MYLCPEVHVKLGKNFRFYLLNFLGWDCRSSQARINCDSRAEEHQRFGPEGGFNTPGPVLDARDRSFRRLPPVLAAERLTVFGGLYNLTKCFLFVWAVSCSSRLSAAAPKPLPVLGEQKATALDIFSTVKFARATGRSPRARLPAELSSTGKICPCLAKHQERGTAASRPCDFR